MSGSSTGGVCVCACALTFQFLQDVHGVAHLQAQLVLAARVIVVDGCGRENSHTVTAATTHRVQTQRRRTMS